MGPFCSCLDGGRQYTWMTHRSNQVDVSVGVTSGTTLGGWVGDTRPVPYREDYSVLDSSPPPFSLPQVYNTEEDRPYMVRRNFTLSKLGGSFGRPSLSNEVKCLRPTEESIRRVG